MCCLLSVVFNIKVLAQKVEFLDLPSVFKKEFEISGLTGKKGVLYLGAERCARIFALDQHTLEVLRVIPLENHEIELEGLDWYKEYLLITDEKKGKIWSLNTNTNELLPLHLEGVDLSFATGSYGLEGIAVYQDSDLVYVLREKNLLNQSEIYTFHICEKNSVLSLECIAVHLIQHPSSHWRYTALTVDKSRHRLLCLKSFYLHSMYPDNKRSIESIAFDDTQEDLLSAQPLHLCSISNEVRAHKKTYATNVEGMYADQDHIYISSDNGQGVPNCDDISVKTAMIRLTL